MSSAPMLPANWGALLEPGIRAWYNQGMETVRNIIPLLFNVQQATKATESIGTIGGVSPDSWDEFKKTLKIPAVGVDIGYETDFPMEEYIVEMPIRRTLMEDDQYGQIQRMTEKLAVGAARKRQIDAASVFNNAFSTDFLGADGDALCSDSHKLGPNGPATGDNNFTLALSKANVSTIRLAMMNFKDDKGNRAEIMPDTLVVPIDLEEAAWEIVNSTLDPTSANNTSNFHARRWRVVTWEYLTDTNAWFMMDSIAARSSLHWFDRVPPNIYLKNVDTTVYSTYVARMRYDFGWSDWRFIAGSNPS